MSQSNQQLIQMTVGDFKDTIELLLETMYEGITPYTRTKNQETGEMEFIPRALTVKEENILNSRMLGLQSFFLHGPPGVGKSAIIKDAAKKLGLGFKDVRLTTLDPVDLRGLPSINKEEGIAEWLQAGFLPRGNELGQRGGILLLDEINSAPPSVQAAAYQLTLDKAIGEYSLPPGWVVIACGNRAKDRSVTYKLPMALANRFTHVEIVVNDEQWVKWARKANIDSFVVNFINLGMSGKSSISAEDDASNKLSGSMLMNFDPKSKELAFATPRSWEFVSKLAPLRDKNFQLYINLVRGTVGNEAGSLFFAYINLRDKLADPEKVLNGKKFTFPKRIDGQYVMISMLVNALSKKGGLTVARVDNYFSKFVAQLEGMGKTDLSVLAGLELYDRFTGNDDNVIEDSEESNDWILRNEKILGVSSDF